MLPPSEIALVVVGLLYVCVVVVNRVVGTLSTICVGRSAVASGLVAGWFVMLGSPVGSELVVDLVVVVSASVDTAVESSSAHEEAC